MKWLLFLWLIVACRNPISPIVPQAEPIQPHADWRKLWDSVETCIERQGNFDAVSWFMAKEQIHDTEGNVYEGMWQYKHNIYLDSLVARPNDVHSPVYNDLVVMHEMAHDILQTGEHPAVFKKCGLLTN